MSVIAFRRGTPIYLQIAAVLEQEIRTNLYRDKILSEQVLTARFGVNRHTLRRAVDELVTAGLIERRHGIGLIVLHDAIDYRLGPATRFTQMLADAGRVAGTKVVRKQVLPAPEDIARQLKLAPGTLLVWVETLREMDQRPLGVVSHYLPHERFPAVASGYDSGSLHAFLWQSHHVRIRRQRSFISAVLPEPEDARLLHIGRNQPILRVRGLNHDTEGVPVELCITRFRGDRLDLAVDFPATEPTPHGPDKTG